MSGPFTFPTRFRRRLTIAFVAVAGIAAGTVSIGSFLFVSQQRHDAFINRAKDQARVMLALTQGEQSAERLDALIAVARNRNGFDTMVVADRVVSSRSDLQPSALPQSVTNDNSDKLASDFVSLNGEPYLVLAADVPSSGDTARLYMLFSEKDVRETLGELRHALLGGWIAVTFCAALVGNAVSKRTLSPVRGSADAANALAEGLLHTRLASGGNDEFGMWSRAFNEMAEALETKIVQLSDAHEREKQFTADVAHDLRTPVTAMVSAASVLKVYLPELPADAKRPAELLVNDVERLRKLITDLLELGRLDSTGESSNPEPVHLRDAVDRALELVGARDNCQLAVEDGIVEIDALRFERVLSNIVRNAMVHGGGEVMLTTARGPGVLVVTIEDEGPGIPEAQMDSIFDRFHKVESSRAGEGSGLGLAIASQHVRVMGGELSVSNRPSGGAAFRIELPIG